MPFDRVGTRWFSPAQDAYGSPRADLAGAGTACEMGTRSRLVSDLISFRRGTFMVAFNRVRCTVVAVSDIQNARMSRGVVARDVLPWADPYVAQLIKNLQDEVRKERRLQGRNRLRQMDAEAAAA